MEKIQNVLMKYLMPIANKLEQQKHIQAIKDGIVASIPIIIVVLSLVHSVLFS